MNIFAWSDKTDQEKLQVKKKLSEKKIEKVNFTPFLLR